MLGFTTPQKYLEIIGCDLHVVFSSFQGKRPSMSTWRPKWQLLNTKITYIVSADNIAVHELVS